MNGAQLLDVASRLAPEMIETFDWSDIWQRPIENGASYEWTMMAALAHEATKQGYSCSYPLAQFKELSALFPMRNEVPFQHAAQAGHSLDINSFPLPQIFLAALLPKITFRKGSRSISVFTEGYPYHKLMTSKVYTERPDIVIVEGETLEQTPELTGEDAFITFGYDPLLRAPVTGQLRTLKSSVVPLTKRDPIEGCELPVLTIIETSVNKSYRKAFEQISRYREAFSSSDSIPHLFLVSGNDVHGPNLDSYFTDLTSANLFDNFCAVAEDIFAKSGLA